MQTTALYKIYDNNINMYQKIKKSHQYISHSSHSHLENEKQL